MGVSWMGWSGDGQLLAVRVENFPRCLWIWNGIDGQLGALLVQMSAITCARWRPTQVERPDLKPMLAFSTGVSRVYFWSPAGTSWIDIPEPSDTDSQQGNSKKGEMTTETSTDKGKMLVTSLKWSADGRKLILFGKGMFCSCDISSGDIMMGEGM